MDCDQPRCSSRRSSATADVVRPRASSTNRLTSLHAPQAKPRVWTGATVISMVSMRHTHANREPDRTVGPQYLLKAYGSPPGWVANRLLDDAAGESLAVREASSINLAQFRRDLVGPDQSLMERLSRSRPLSVDDSFIGKS